MRFGGPILGGVADPETWTGRVRELGYSAANLPVRQTVDHQLAREYAAAAQRADVVIAEVGAFGFNTISPDEEIRRAAITACQERLAVADEVVERCCVNVAG